MYVTLHAKDLACNVTFIDPHAKSFKDLFVRENKN